MDVESCMSSLRLEFGTTKFDQLQNPN